MRTLSRLTLRLPRPKDTNVPRHPRRSFTVVMTLTLALGGAALPLAGSASATVPACEPTAHDRPVCPADAPAEEASFLDPTAKVTSPRNVDLEAQVYVAPFAQLLASGRAGIHIGPESNVQDNVIVTAAVSRRASERTALEAVELTADSGVTTGERVILAHGSSVRGPARLGVEEEGAPPLANDSGVFISFGARVDGAVIERDSGLSALSRVGPGVRLHSGFIVLPGKNVTTQAQADDPALGKVRPIVETDRAFNAGVVEVNVGLAREYSKLAREDARAVRGINIDPGGNVFDKERDAPSVESALCTGPSVREPDFRNRIIGDACFEDSLDELGEKMGERTSLRADEGGPFGLGTIKDMGNGVIFHALEGTDLRVGNDVTYGDRAIVHGGGRPAVDPTTGLAAPTLVGNRVEIGTDAVVFRALVRNDVTIGDRSLVVGSELAKGQTIPDRTIYANNEVFGPVEW